MADESNVEALVDEPSTAATDEAPETLAEALGEDGPGIAAEIESELAPDSPSESEPPAPDPAVDMSSRLGLLSDVEVTVTARLCATTHPLGRILSMAPGSTLDLGKNTNAPIELLANGVLVAYGEVVEVGGNLGVRITGLAES